MVVALPSRFWIPSRSAIASPRARFERPAKSMSRFCGVRSIHVAWSPLLIAEAGIPAPVKSGIGVSRLTAASLSCSITLEVYLSGAGAAERVGGNVAGDHGAGSGPRPISDRYGGDEDSVAGRADITTDRGALLPLSIVVGGDVDCTDVRFLAALRVADVGEVRDLGPRPDRRVLDLDERPRLGVGADVGPRAQAAEGPDLGSPADAGGDGDHVWADIGSRLDPRLAAQHRERLDDRV